MIEWLLIQNLVLIQTARISFEKGLNIITGETGAGKSAVLSALRLMLGERTDTTLIGKEGELAVIEAKIQLKQAPVLIRREIHRSGKSRAFVNDELISLTELRALFQGSVELADQGSAYKFFESDTLRSLLDQFGPIDATPFEEAFQKWEALRIQIEALSQEAAAIQRDEVFLRDALATLDQVNWQEGEEEKLTALHANFALSEKSTEKLAALSQFLSEEALLPTLKRFVNQCESLKLPELSNLLKNGHANLEEASHFLSSHLSNVDFSPQQLLQIEERIGEIESVKRKFAKTQAESKQLREIARQKIERLEQFEDEINLAKSTYIAQEEQVRSLAKKLTEERGKAATLLATAIRRELHELNLKEAKLEIKVSPRPLSKTGQDQILWLFSANVGQPLLPIDQGASGGELSRLLLAFKMVIKEKQCLILDEIDGNVGGFTAALLGKKLQELSKVCQIICITHFVQVAKCALHHILVTKQTNEKGTSTHLKVLLETELNAEYARMIGAS